MICSIWYNIVIGDDYMNNAFSGMYNNMYGVAYNPYQSSYQMAMQAQQNMSQVQAQSSITFVNGLEGAKGYMLPPNSAIVLMDADNSMFYIKSTNNLGIASISSYKFTECNTSEDNDIYVKKSEITKYIDDYLGLQRGTGNVKSNNEVSE